MGVVHNSSQAHLALVQDGLPVHRISWLRGWQPFRHVGFGGLGRLSGGFSGGVLFIKGKLPFLCRPVFPFGYPFLAAVQEVDLVKPLPVAHLHDFTLEIFHSGVGAAVLAALPCIGWSVHVGQKRDFINPQGVDDDMHMDIAAVVMPVRVGAD